MMTSRIHEFFSTASVCSGKRARAGNITWKMICGVFLLCAGNALVAPAQTFTVLTDFDGTNGGRGSSFLVQGFDGNFYGTTSKFWAGQGPGTVFKVTPGGALTTLYSFTGVMSEGANPLGGLVLATDGNFYGTTFDGGLMGKGTIFKISPRGALTTLYSFCIVTPAGLCADGANPSAAMVQGSDGNFYGTTSAGGTDGYGGGLNGYGTVFRITSSGTLTTLHSFNSADGYEPDAALVEGSDGNLYGATQFGGLGHGTVFKISRAGKLTTLHTFNGTDGSHPAAAPVQGTDGMFYGTTSGGGLYDYGTVFSITSSGTLTRLNNFGPGVNGPVASLIQATDGNFYGTTEYPQQGGTYGTMYRVRTGGALLILHKFNGEPDGAGPIAAVVQGTDGNFYGETDMDGAHFSGTVFKLSVGLGPFVIFIRNSAKVGQTAQILGQGFTGTSSVSFNGTPATFTIKSGTYLTATVPAGATTGFVTVTTTNGTLKSNQIFRVPPQIFQISPTSGPVGTSVIITGQSLTKTREVLLGPEYAPVSFTVDSDTQITAIIPGGAAGGKFTVRTSGGTAMSLVGFDITP